MPLPCRLASEIACIASSSPRETCDRVRHLHICCRTVKERPTREGHSNRLLALAVSLLAAAALVALGAGCGGGGSTPKIDKVITVGENPTDVVTAFGSVWVVNGDAVARVDPKTNALQLKKFIPTAEGANGIAAGGNRIWVACALSASVVEIDPNINQVVANIPAASRPT